jgi:hypothetical protein
VDAIWIIAIIVVIAVLAVAVAWIGAGRAHSNALREGFGLEYDRALMRGGSRRRSEAELDARRRRVRSLHLRDISPIRAQEYAERWRIVQGRFVDDPAGSIRQADQLCIIVMNERGYPMADSEQRAADLSVEHAEMVSRYRIAHAISQAAERGEATTESLRNAMVDYRALFEALLEAPPTPRRMRPPRESRVTR